MKISHDKRSGRVSEPVQVYLDSRERARLDRLAAELDTTKSDVIRRSLEALEQQLTDPAAHPALRIIGLSAGHERRSSPGYDLALEHDRALAEDEPASWTGAGKKKRGR
jgi:Arc/MetJ-type ribon-helix-helix transcriptional regulator